MLIIILAIAIVLVAWSLHLIQEALDQREFSLMLAGTLVAFAAAALVGVYFLMGNYVGYISKMAHYSTYEPVYDVHLVSITQQLDQGQLIEPR